MKTHAGCCGCGLPKMGRRSFLTAVGGGAAGVAAARAASAAAAAKDSVPNAARGGDAGTVLGVKPLTVLPILAYHLYERREATSWRPWGGLHTASDVDEEVNRIRAELKSLEDMAEFPVRFLPIQRSGNSEQAESISKIEADVRLIYGASGSLEPLIDPEGHNLVFVRHKSGPVYLWYEIAHPRLLRKTVDEYGQPGLGPGDVVVDELDDVLWRLRALYALHNTRGVNIVAIGGPHGWGKGGEAAPGIAREAWGMNILDVSYDDLGKRIEAARKDPDQVRAAEGEAEAYLRLAGTKLCTAKEYVTRAFLLTGLFREVMEEAKAHAITVNECMTTIIPMAETTACLSLSLLNDEGYLAFCESDFVVIPSGVLLNRIAASPVFLQDPTYPHHGIVTVAHCTAPRRMDGHTLEPAEVMTHFESEYGAAPKVAMRLGQTVTMIDPDFGNQRWLGFRGTIVDNPYLDICRSQVDVAIEGDCDYLAQEMRGFHWMLAYGDHRREIGYALGKADIEWLDLTATKLGTA